ncbi:MAG: DsbA family protein [Actinomycetota bacterium]
MTSSSRRDKSTHRSTRGPLIIAAIAAVVTLAFILISILAGNPAGDTAEGLPDPAASAKATGQEMGATTSSGEEVAEEPAFEAVDTLPNIARRINGDPTAVGAIDAPVVMVEYSEFQCPYCRKFALDIAPELQGYIDDGTLRIEWRDFPLLGEESTTASLGGHAAANQGKFWEFHDAVFANQPPQNSGQITEEWLVGIAESIGLDTEQFRADLTDPATAAAVEENRQEAFDILATSTPLFFVNKIPIVGAQPVETFVDVIEFARAEASG